MPSFKAMKAGMTDQFWKRDDMVMQLTPVYKRHLSEVDINEVN
ncbi:MAG: hypothetical protein ACKO1F_06980 [Flammeovirgaceae bacterium]